MAEQFGFEQVLGNGRGIERDERAVGTRAVLVQRARNQFLAGAGLAGDHHRDVRLRQPPDGAEHVLHRRRLAEDLRRIDQPVVHLLFAQAFFQRTADQLDRLVDIERLGQVFEGPALERCHRAVQVRVGGHHDDRQARVPRLDGLQQVQPGAAGHADIGNQHLRLVFFQRGQHVSHIGEAAREQAFTGKGLFQDPAD
ncbi:hypothetical protein FQZ97_1044530 [compost metagenome]